MSEFDRFIVAKDERGLETYVFAQQIVAIREMGDNSGGTAILTAAGMFFSKMPVDAVRGYLWKLGAKQ